MTRTRILRIGGGGAVLALAITAVAALQSGPGGHAAPIIVHLPTTIATTPAPATVVPPSTASPPGFVKEADTYHRLDNANQSIWATVEHPVAARAEPSARTPVVGRLDTRTPEGTTGDVLLLERAVLSGHIWLRVLLPILPNDSTGWVPRDALGSYHIVTTNLIIDTRHLRAILYDKGRVVFTAPIGVGTAATPTPKGHFYIRDRLAGFSGSAFYGPVAFGTSARSAILTDWPGGGYIGIHGTNTPAQLPGRISHGCIRLRNPDILRLAQLLPVGSPVTIT